MRVCVWNALRLDGWGMVGVARTYEKKRPITLSLCIGYGMYTENIHTRACVCPNARSCSASRRAVASVSQSVQWCKCDYARSSTTAQNCTCVSCTVLYQYTTNTFNTHVLLSECPTHNTILYYTNTAHTHTHTHKIAQSHPSSAPRARVCMNCVKLARAPAFTKR